jgi:hypothetical protein
MKPYRSFVTSAILLIVAAHPADAGLIILGNLPQTDDNSFATIDAGTDNIGSNFMKVQQAISFIMPSESYPLDHVDLRLRGYNTTAGDVAAVAFYQDNGSDLPGALFGGLFLSPLSTSDDPSTFTFLPMASLTLAASTKYWLMLDATAGEYDWRASSPSITPTSQVGASFGRQIGFVDEVPREVELVISSFEIVTSVPEPATNVLILGMAVGFAMFRPRGVKLPA